LWRGDELSHARRKMQRETSASSEQRPQSSLAEALERLIGILARQAAREALGSAPPSIKEPANE